MAVDVLLAGQCRRGEKQYGTDHGHRQQSLRDTLRLAGAGNFHGAEIS